MLLKLFLVVNSSEGKGLDVVVINVLKDLIADIQTSAIPTK